MRWAPILDPDVLVLPLGPVQCGEDCVDQHRFVRLLVHALRQPDGRECLPITPNIAKHHGLCWVLAVVSEFDGGVRGSWENCTVPAVPPVHILVNMEEVLLVAEYEHLAFAPLFELVDNELGPLEPLSPLCSSPKLYPPLDKALQAQVLLDHPAHGPGRCHEVPAQGPDGGAGVLVYLGLGRLLSLLLTKKTCIFF